MADDAEDRGLAPIYRRAVELREAGASDETIALTLGVAVEAVPTLVELARRKQAAADDGTHKGEGTTCTSSTDQ